MTRLGRQIEDRSTSWRRARVGLLACVLLALSACGFATTQAPTDVTDESAVLRGTAHSTEAGSITHWFEYGPTTDYGESTPVESAQIVDSGVGLPVQATVTGLDPATTYHFRLCVKDANGHGVCAYDNTFTTDEDSTPPVCSAVFPGSTPYALGDGATVTVTIDCARVTDPISFVCFDFTFVDNLLDQDETLIIRVPGNSGFGFSNPTTTSQDGRTSCVPDDLVAETFGDGEASFDLVLDPGTSLTIAQLNVRFLTAVG
jgi:hypothetical protein